MVRGLVGSALLLGAILPSTLFAYSEIIAFGDSFTDNGNIYQLTGGTIPQSPPNYLGRFCNGLVWVEWLPSELGQPALPLADIAFGGAQSGVEEIPPGMRLQVQRYLESFPPVDPDALCILFIGTNDYTIVTNTRTVIEENDPAVAQVIGNIRICLDALAADGAENFLLLNLPDIGKFPFRSTGPESAAITELCQQHNAALEIELDNFRSDSETRVVLLDVWNLFETLQADPETFGFTDITEACWDGTNAPCADPNSHLFWDIVHPTERAHEWVAQYAAEALREMTAIPATTWMIY